MKLLVKNPDTFSLGIIGMTEGNGHPHLWSAIFNGYDREAMMRECPFAGITACLNKEAADKLRIVGANDIFTPSKRKFRSLLISSVPGNLRFRSVKPTN